jgi:predicted kinase
MKSLQLEKPHAIIVIGLQGSGKSFFASKFADTFNAPFFDQSFFAKSARDTAAASELMDNALKQVVKTGRSVVIELSLATRTERSELSSQLRASGYVPLYVWAQVDADTAMARASKTSGVGQDEYRDRMKRFSPPHPTEKALVISGKHTFATQAKAVLKKLSSPRAATPAPEERRPAVRGQIIVR